MRQAKSMTEELEEYECKVCPTCGSCSGMYTANSMNCLTEVLGMGLQGNGTIPAVYSERIQSGENMLACRLWSCCEKNIRPRDIMTREGIHERPDRGYGTGLFHQQYAASSGYRS